MKLNNAQRITKFQFLFALFSILKLIDCEEFSKIIQKSEHRIHDNSSNFTNIYVAFKDLSYALFLNNTNMTTNRIINSKHAYNFTRKSISKACRALIKKMILINSEAHSNKFNNYDNSNTENILLSIKNKNENRNSDGYQGHKGFKGHHASHIKYIKCLLKLKELKNIIGDDESFNKMNSDFKMINFMDDFLHKKNM